MPFVDLSQQQQQEILSTVVRDAVQQSGLSYQQIADRLCCSKSKIVFLVNGKRRFNLLYWMQFCKAINISPDDFLKKLENEIP